MGVAAVMFVRNKAPISPEKVRRLSADLCEAFGPEYFWIFRPRKWDDKLQGQHALEIVDEIWPDGLRPGPGEQFVEVHLTGRYYGIGYERGDLPPFLMIAAWLRARIPGAEVWYGGDSGGIEPLSAEALWEHFVKVGHRPYRGGMVLGEEEKELPFCDFCGEYPIQYGWGNGWAAARCLGCGQTWQKLDQNWFVPCEKCAKEKMRSHPQGETCPGVSL